MRSPAFLPAPLALATSTALVLLAAGLAPAHASQKLELTIENGQVLEIPLNVNQPAGVRTNGNIHASCQLGSNGRCPGIGSSVTPPTGPTITISSPAEGAVIAATDTNARLNWSAPQAQTCYGLSVSPDITETAAWKKEWAKTGSFQVGNLPRNTSGDRNYSFTLRCYGTGADGVVGYTDITRNFKLAPSTTPNPPAGNSCQQYMNEHGLVAGQNGFQPTALARRNYLFDSGVFVSGAGNGSPITFDGMINSGLVGTANLPGGIARNEYLSIQIDVSQSLAPNKGFSLIWVEQQDGGSTIKPGKLEVTLSPCPGDFRKRHATNTSTDYWMRAHCSRTITRAGGPIYFRGSGTGQPGVVCYIPSPSTLTPGTQTIYLNMTTHDMDVFRVNPGADPNANNTCAGSQCGYRFDIMRAD